MISQGILSTFRVCLVLKSSHLLDFNVLSLPYLVLTVYYC
jgi:hypothetical protein